MHAKRSWIAFMVPVFFLLVRDAAFLKDLPQIIPRADISLLFDHAVLVPFWLLFMTAAAVSLGAALLKLLFDEWPLTQLEALLFSIPIGFGMLSLAVLALGLSGHVSFGLFAGLLALPTALLSGRTLKYLRRAPFSLPGSFENWRTLEWISVGLLAWIAFHGLVLSTAPPTEGDTLAYHFGNSRVYLDEGRVFYQRSKLWGCFPGNMEMLYLMSFKLMGPTLAQWVQLLFSLLVPAGIFLYGSRFFKSPLIGLLAAAIFSVQPVFTSFLGSGMVDSSVTLLFFLSLMTFSFWIESDNPRWMVLCGVFAGLACGTKYPAIPTSVMLGALMLLTMAILRRFRAKEFVIFGVVLAAVALPWYVRNYVWTGNPFWPIFYSIFGGKDLTAEQTHYLAQLQFRPGLEPGLRSWFAIAWEMISKPRSRPYYNPEYITWPFLLVAGLLAVKKIKVPWTIALMLGFGVLSSLPMFWDCSFWRYFTPALPGFCLALAWGIAALRPFAGAGIWLLVGLFVLAGLRVNHVKELYPAAGLPTPSAASQDPEDGYLEAAMNYYPIYRTINHETPKDATFLLFWQTDAFHIKRPFHFADPLNNIGIIPYKDFKSVDDLHKHLQGMKIRYVVYNSTRVQFPNPWDAARLPEWYWQGVQLLQELMQKKCRLMQETNGVFLYELN